MGETAKDKMAKSREVSRKITDKEGGSSSNKYLLLRYPQQIQSSLILSLIMFVTGIVIASSTVITDKLMEGDDGFKITLDEASWITSILQLGQLAGSVFSGLIVTAVGPKRFGILVVGLFIAGLFIIGTLAHSTLVICVGRFILGIPTVSYKICLQCLVCELSHPSIRGITGTLGMTMFSFGFSAGMLSGLLLPWRWSITWPILVCLGCGLGLLRMHESPVWLLRKKRVDEAEQALRFYDREEDQIPEEVKGIQECLQVQNLENDTTLVAKMKKIVSQFFVPEFYKPFSYLLVTMILIEWSCFSVLAFYLITIFRLTNSPFDPYVTSTIAGMSRVLPALVGSGLLFKFPRRPLFLGSCAVIAACLGSMGAYTYLAENGYKPELVEALNWMPLVLVILIYVAFAVGYGSISALLLGELLPAESKNLGNSMISFIQIMASFAMVKCAPLFFTGVGIHGLFFLFSGVVTLNMCFSMLFMPETRGMSLVAIQRNYSRKVPDGSSGKGPIRDQSEKVANPGVENEDCEKC